MNVRLAVIGALAAVVVVPSARAAVPHTLSPERIERDLIAGRAVVDHNAVIPGTVDLHDYAGKIKNSFVCNGCTFKGGVIAPHVVFEREVDLSESTVNGALDLHGAVFREPTLFKQTAFQGKTDFAFATFNDLGFFRESTFANSADFTSAQFHSVARFGKATFGSDDFFDEALFAAPALFTETRFVKVANFSAAAFGNASDFRGAFFLAGEGGRPGKPAAFFTNANFAGRTEFSNALFSHEAKFDGARFGSDALFIATRLGSDEPALLFENTAVGGRIDLRRLNEPDEFDGSVQFHNVSADALVFDEIRYGPSGKLTMDDVGAKDVFLDIYDERHVDATSIDEQRLLHTAEETAKTAGDLRLANDIHYRIQEIARGDEVWPQRILDHGFYRGVAGYFVRPLRPLYWLLALVIFAAVVRALRSETPEPERPTRAAGAGAPVGRGAQPTRGSGGPVRRAWLNFVHALEYTITRRGEVPAEPKPLRRLELTVYAVLLASFLLALANTNASLRDMVDAIV